jgi:hypothetical protein
MKELKVISEQVEAQMRDLARQSIERLAVLYPQAREIDLLNAYLQVFTAGITEDE